MATNAVANATKMVGLATRSFQAVNLPTQIATKTYKLATKFLFLSRQKRLDFIFNLEPCSCRRKCLNVNEFEQFEVRMFLTGTVCTAQ